MGWSRVSGNGRRLHLLLGRCARRPGPGETAPPVAHRFRCGAATPLLASTATVPRTIKSRQELGPPGLHGTAGPNPHSRRIASGSKLPLVRMVRVIKSRPACLFSRASARAAEAGLPRLFGGSVVTGHKARATDDYPCGTGHQRSSSSDGRELPRSPLLLHRRPTSFETRPAGAPQRLNAPIYAKYNSFEFQIFASDPPRRIARRASGALDLRQTSERSRPLPGRRR